MRIKNISAPLLFKATHSGHLNRSVVKKGRIFQMNQYEITVLGGLLKFDIIIPELAKHVEKYIVKDSLQGKLSRRDEDYLDKGFDLEAAKIRYKDEV